MKTATKLLFLTVFVVGLAYYLHIPLPEDFPDRNRAQLRELFNRLVVFYPLKLIQYIGPEWVVWYIRLFRLSPPSDLEHSTTEDRTFDGVKVRVYEPKEGRSSDAAIVFIHGGGFVISSVDFYDGLVEALVKETRLVAVSIEYRRAPEHPFPTPMMDCERATIHFIRHEHKRYGFDPNKVILMGDSAGANAAAVLTHRFKQRNDLPRIKLQILVYPWMQFLDYMGPSYQSYNRSYAGTSLLSPRISALMFLFYAGVDAKSENVEKVLRNEHVTKSARDTMPQFEHVKHENLPAIYRKDEHYDKSAFPEGDSKLFELVKPMMFDCNFSPLLCNDWSDLPQALVITCQYDILRDDGIWYAERLKKNRIQTDHLHYDNGYHGVLSAVGFKELANKMMSDIASFVLRNI